MPIEDVCSELEKFGVVVDVYEIEKSNPSERQLGQVEKNLWNLLQSILLYNRSKDSLVYEMTKEMENGNSQNQRRREAAISQ